MPSRQTTNTWLSETERKELVDGGHFNSGSSQTGSLRAAIRTPAASTAAKTIQNADAMSIMDCGGEECGSS